MESYLSRWARVAGVVRSFTATNSMFGLPRALRKTLRPMRPKPLIPTFTAAMISVAPVVYYGCFDELGRWGAQQDRLRPPMRMLSPWRGWRQLNQHWLFPQSNGVFDRRPGWLGFRS